MKILLIGYGKMGQAIERLAKERGHEIAGTIDVSNLDELKSIDPLTVDVAIEFTRPESAFENLKVCMERGIKVISGTTGWLENLDQIEALCQSQNGTFMYASNYSLGVNLFFKLNEYLSRLMNAHHQYNPTMTETHHIHKLDAPSGTAITLAEGLMKHSNIKSNWVNQKTEKSNELEIISLREGEVPGTHVVTYSTPMDEIEIKHTAHTRDSFALGAVIVAEWIADKAGVLTMDDFLQIN